ncbi:MAG: DUF1906 domain-containing protein [Clostridia bacterium]|nr:DUF1906 domain-containing protein [Clostridia bacterium]
MKKILTFLMLTVLILSSAILFSFGAESSADVRIKEVQQYLNTEFDSYIDYIPCDGVSSPYMCKALVYALQALEGLPTGTANGNFGPTTKKCCPEIPYDGSALSYSGKKYTDSQIKEFTRLLQYALYVNGFDAGEADGIFDEEVQTALSDFQTLMGMEVTAKAELATWLRLLTAPGDTSRSAEAADSATILDERKADYLYSEGYRYIGRYLTNAAEGYDKALTRQEAEIILDAGLHFFPIYQTSGRKAEYFTASQGTADAEKAMTAAFKLGLPEGTVIYFAVDFDATRTQMKNNILSYFKGVSERMSKVSYRAGVYGSKGVCRTVSEKGYAHFSFVSSLSSGHYGNSGFKMPENWSFNQFDEITVNDGKTSFGIDKNDYSGRDEGVSCLVEPHTHSYKSSVTKEATCTKKGTMLYSCSCGDGYTASIAKKAHTPVTDKAVSPTYKKSGKTKGSHCKSCGEVLTAQETVARLKLGKVKSLKVSKTYSASVKLSWKKVTGAEGYKVQYSTDGKKWTSLTTEKTSLTVKKLKSGKSYRFRVRATAGKYSGDYSSQVKTVTKVSAGELKKLKSSKSAQLTATWTKLSGADGYQLYLSTSKKFTSKTTKKVTVKKGKTVKTTVKSLKKNKKYYVKIRGYKTVNDKKVYGSFSEVKSIKVKK